jgi:hypothetical protein
MARAPKVFAADLDGLHEWIVAAANQRAALDALGVHQDLFAQGRARVEHDPVKVEFARETPGVPLRRPKGSKADFEPASGADGAWSAALEAAPRGGKAGRAAKATGAKARVAAKPPVASRAPTAAQRKAVREADKARRAFEREAATAFADIDRERAALDRRERKLRLDLDRRREKLTRALEKARAAYERAGG